MAQVLRRLSTPSLPGGVGPRSRPRLGHLVTAHDATFDPQGKLFLGQLDGEDLARANEAATAGLEGELEKDATVLTRPCSIADFSAADPGTQEREALLARPPRPPCFSEAVVTGEHHDLQGRPLAVSTPLEEYAKETTSTHEKQKQTRGTRCNGAQEGGQGRRAGS